MSMTTLYTLINRSHIIHNPIVFQINLYISVRLFLSKQKQYRHVTSHLQNDIGDDRLRNYTKLYSKRRMLKVLGVFFLFPK